ncbi:methyltransferase domain-containing protein [Desulfovibrio subterraneus]|uniref:methyltransferase domain-containing protein n=1 Tax=Desulfovibrio subterraneus TaxID=2718620 RepID=UPI00157B64AC|nr:methyltransferase domain-containing protein [Desulfovibrio subterraneus]
MAISARCADVFLFNASPGNLDHCLYKLLALRLRYPDVPMVMRVDGPIYCTRGQDKDYDKAFHLLARKWFNGVVFQSEWSRRQHMKLGMCGDWAETVIVNAPDPAKFYRKKQTTPSRPCHIIATSWSANVRKGFDVYQWLDDNLDFKRYSMTFVGNAPVEFSNIKHVQPLNSEALGDLLRSSDIYITASRHDPCSNSLVEARHCGLPVVAFNDGGHPELVRSGGLLFDNVEALPELLDKICAEYESFTSRFDLPSLGAVSDSYLEFCCSQAQISRQKQMGFGLKLASRVQSGGVALRVLWRIFLARIKRKFGVLMRRSCGNDVLPVRAEGEVRPIPDTFEEFQERLSAYYHDYYCNVLGLPDWQKRVQIRLQEENSFGERVVLKFEQITGVELTDKKVLVVGSGTGAEIGSLLRRTAQVYGVEPGGEGVALCRYRVSVAGGAPEQVQLGVAEALPWEDGFFDVVLCSTVLEHVQCVERAISEMVRVCRKGGRVFMALPDYRYPYEDHYKMLMPTFLPKVALKAYLKLRRRPVDFLDTLNFLTATQVDSILHALGGRGVDFIRYIEALPAGRVHPLVWWYARLRNVTKMQRIVLFP